MFYQNQQFIDYFINLMKKCNEIILEVYNTDFEKEYKDDNSPLTLADKKTNDMIYNALEFINRDLNMNILIISEEIKNKSYEERKKYEWCWLVDPLDGTKEFIKKNGQFTCNIGLIYNGEPVFGIVSVPVTDEIYYGIKNVGSYKISNNVAKLLCCSNMQIPIRIVVSNSHMNDETKNFLQKYTEYEQMNIGSSIKLLLLTENKADIYPRLAPTYEWDTCAAHAIVKYAGGTVLRYDTSVELQYNKQNLLNPHFIAMAAK